MPTTLIEPMADGVIVAPRSNGTWNATLGLEGKDCWACAVDPADPAVIYVASMEGLFRSGDAGRSWHRVGEDLPSQIFWSVAVSAVEKGSDGRGVVYAGTQPTMLYRSEDGGKTWQDSPTINDLPSKPTWKYPPKPSTHHLRCICPDPHQEGVLLIGVEQGGIMRSTDFGKTWRDRQPDGKGDAHTITTHPGAPHRIYVAAGDGYSESYDDGDTWKALDDGLPHRYLMGVSIDPADPDTIVTTNSKNWFRAHFPPFPSNTVYRKTRETDWTEVSDGLPKPLGQRNTGRVATNPSEPHVFYFSENSGELYRSQDAGKTWERQTVKWPAGYKNKQAHHLVIVDID
jgi:photosystem II stability/assembly factor-like uncharacterized protein